MGSSQLALERLFELERGLRSSIREDQEKTLQSIPAFFDEFGDSQEAMMGLTLRLTDFFKSKGNERRLELTKFLELNCAKPLESLQEGGEEFGRRLISLWETNDSLLKSLVLRSNTVLLGNFLIDGCLPY